MEMSGFNATDAEHKAADDWFKSKGIRPTCTQCNNNTLNMGRPVLAPVVMEDGSVAVFGSDTYLFSFLPFVCDNCAHVEWFFPRQMRGLEHLGGQGT
jgi:hypothetical protein